jgi:hypothetical protein
LDDEDEIRREVDRFYEIAWESLTAAWSSVRAVAEALLDHEALDRDGFAAAIGDVDLHGTVRPLQRARGLITRVAAPSLPVAESYATRTSERKPKNDPKPPDADDARVTALLEALRRHERLAAVVEGFEARKKEPRGRKFGSNGLTVNRKLFALFTQRTLVVKLPRERVAELVERGTGEPFDPGHGRLMKEWLKVTSKKASWTELAIEAFVFVGGKR